VVKLAEHSGYGAAGGAVHPPSGLVRPAVFAGQLTGLAVWKGSLGGWIPALGMLPPPDHDERGRTATVLLVHLAYGAAPSLTPYRLADQRRPCAPSGERRPQA